MNFTYTNQDGVSLTLGNRRPFWITRLDGTGDIKNIIATFKAPDQDGSAFVSSTLDNREITIEGTIVADDAESVYALRRQLLQQFTPKQQGAFVMRGMRINCIVASVKLTVSTRERVPNFFISLICPSPYFESGTPLREELALWQSRFEFPLEIIMPPGVELGARQPSQIITLINAGDVPSGFELIITAVGTVVNPVLENMDTGEFIKLNRTLVGGEEVRITTTFGDKRVESTFDLVVTNVFQNIDVGSTFFQLTPGRNLLRYDAQSGVDEMEVTIFYTPRFLGI